MANAVALPVPFRRVGFLVVGLLVANSAAAAEDTAKSANAETIRLINEKLAEKWQPNKLTPSARCTDYEFIRRTSLDIIGRIATPKEVSQFLKDPPEVRRASLIERLLKSEEYAKNFANIWT